jgi:hypothetical protein
MPNKIGKDVPNILIMNQDVIMSLSFAEGNKCTFTTLYKFLEGTKLGDQPDFAEFDQTQKYGVLTSPNDGVYFSLAGGTPFELDLDETFNL